MKRIIRLTEEDLHNHIKHLIIEKLGVPENILETAEEVYHQIVSELQDITNGNNRLQKRYNKNTGQYELVTQRLISGNYRISDSIFTKIKFLVVYIPTNQYTETVVSSMGSGHGVNLNFNDFRITYAFDEDTIRLRIIFLFPPDNQNFLQDAVDIITKDPNERISAISHELLHSYSNIKRKGIKARKESEYMFYNDAMAEFMDDSPALTKFLTTLYYLDGYENLARPSQVASQIRTKNITKNQFRDFLENDQTYNELKNIRDYTYDDFRRDLWNDIKNLSAPPNMPPETKFNRFLEYAFEFIKDGKIGTNKNFLTNELSKQSAANIGDAQFQNLVNQMTNDNLKKANNELEKYAQSQYGDKNISRFFENTIKIFNFVAGELLKKLSKLYDMAKDDTISTDVHSKINAKTKNLNEQPVKVDKNSLIITKEDVLAMKGKTKDIYWNTKK